MCFSMAMTIDREERQTARLQGIITVATFIDHGQGQQRQERQRVLRQQYRY